MEERRRQRCRGVEEVARRSEDLQSGKQSGESSQSANPPERRGAQSCAGRRIDLRTEGGRRKERQRKWERGRNTCGDAVQTVRTASVETVDRESERDERKETENEREKERERWMKREECEGVRNQERGGGPSGMENAETRPQLRRYQRGYCTSAADRGTGGCAAKGRH